MGSASVKQVYNLFLINFILTISREIVDFSTVQLLRLPTHRLSGPQFSAVMAYSSSSSGTAPSVYPYGGSELAAGDRTYLAQSIMYHVYSGYKLGMMCIIVGEPGYGWD